MKKQIRSAPPIGIVITLPARFFEENPVERYENIISRIDSGHGHWERVMKNLPVHDILYVYTVYHGKVQHRMNLVDMWRDKTKRFIKTDGTWRTFEHCNGIVTAGPVARPPREVPMKGFQGFKYVYEELF